jgi:hypothetical protein
MSVHKAVKRGNVFVCAICGVRWPCLGAHQMAIQAGAKQS